MRLVYLLWGAPGYLAGCGVSLFWLVVGTVGKQKAESKMVGSFMLGANLGRPQGAFQGLEKLVRRLRILIFLF